jgi:hypothetical protein
VRTKYTQVHKNHNHSKTAKIVKSVQLKVAMNEKKILEGEEHLRLAAKALKTGFLKWSPDYDLAGDEYNKAATCFKVRWTFVRP